MAMKKIYAVLSDDSVFFAKVYRDTEWNEYVVRYLVGQKMAGTSHHDDKQDAIGTADAEVGRYEALSKAEQIALLKKHDPTSVWLPESAREDNPDGVPEQIRIDRKKTAQGYKVIATFGLMDTKTFFVADWRAFLEQRGWSNIPRVFA